MTHPIELALHVLLCAVIFWSCFCRQAKSTKHTTRPQIRAAFWLLSLAALSTGVAPWAHLVWPEWSVHRVSWPELLMLLAIAAVQVATAHYWRGGTPQSFCIKESQP